MSVQPRGPLIGIDLGGTKLAGGVVVLGGDGEPRLLIEERVPTPATADELVEAMQAMVLHLCAAAPEPPCSVGAGIAGHVGLDGVVVQAANTAMAVGVDLAGPLARASGLPVSIDNDANVVAMVAQREAETHVGALVAVTFGTGIGGGLVLDGALWRGAAGLAGEPGHMVVDAGGPRCRCGQSGCWEAVASGTALGALARAHADARGAPGLLRRAGRVESLDGEIVVAALREGDPDAAAVWDSWTGWVALGVANLIQLLDPDLIVLGGGVSAAGELLTQPVLKHLEAMSVGLAHRRLRLRCAPGGPAAGVVGAAIMGHLRRGTPSSGSSSGG
ncbi:MAG: ROK family protein [Microthrixaceae bacterium]